MFKLTLAFGGGVLVGLWLAKQYARKELDGTIHDALNHVGLAGGALEQTVKDTLQPIVVGN